MRFQYGFHTGFGWSLNWNNSDSSLTCEIVCRLSKGTSRSQGNTLMKLPLTEKRNNKKPKIIKGIIILILVLILLFIVGMRGNALEIGKSALEDTNFASGGIGIEISEEIFLVVQCESRWDNSARGKAGEIGLSQWMPATWEYYTQKKGLDLNIYNEHHQLQLMKLAWEDGLQRWWTCYRNLYEKM